MSIKVTDPMKEHEGSKDMFVSYAVQTKVSFKFGAFSQISHPIQLPQLRSLVSCPRRYCIPRFSSIPHRGPADRPSNLTSQPCLVFVVAFGKYF
jgi:hypothetical protein